MSRALNAGALIVANTSPGFSRNDLENLTSKEHCSERVEAMHDSIETPFKMKNVRQEEIRALKDKLIEYKESSERNRSQVKGINVG